MKKKTIVIMNESHSILPQQEAMLKAKFGTYEFLSVPAEGWTREEMDAVHDQLTVTDRGRINVVFVSPVPYLLAKMAHTIGFASGYQTGAALAGTLTHLFLLHNDRRDKRELPDGRIIMTAAREGWKLLWV